MTPIDERRHLLEGPAREERPRGVGIVSITAKTHGDATSVLSRAQEVMRIIVDCAGTPWPKPDEWRALLPEWFLAASGPERTTEEIEQWLRWWRSLPPDISGRVEREQKWSLDDWLFWVDPKERQWFWWDGVIVDSNTARVEVDVPGWPTSLGAVEWLLRAAGAIEVDVDS